MNKRIFRLIISLMLVCCIILIPSSNLRAESNIVSEDSISIVEAEKIAKMHIDYILNANIDSGLWSDELIIKNEINLYDVDEIISAYCIEYTNMQEENCGYIVVGANQMYAPIIEYATSGTFCKKMRKCII